MNKRILYSNNGVISDFSVSLDRYKTGTHAFSMVAAEDYLYIGSIVPFNHLYFKFDGLNVNSEISALTLEYWESGEFVPVIDLIDETSVSGATFAQSGFATWSTNKDDGWIREDTNYGGNSVTGLTSVDIYGMYWLRLSFSADLTAGVSLSWIGQKFSDDFDLGGEHSDLVRSNFKTAFEAGKTDWEEQHVIAAQLIINEMIAKKVIFEEGQLLKKEDFRMASVKKVAQIIYNSMGKDYNSQRDEAKAEYDNRINKVIPSTDKNNNGRRDSQEITGKLYR